MRWPATVAALAEHERVHPQTISSEIRAGRLPARKVGGAIRIDQEHYEAWKRESVIRPRAKRQSRSTRRRGAGSFRGHLKTVEGGRA